MARTLAQIEQQIEQLEQLAERMKAKEKGGVIERIRTAIAYYGLTADELFAGTTQPANPLKTRGPAKAGKTKRVSVIRYRDDQGHSWTGHGQRPRWFNEALANGKTREQLEVKV